MKLIDFHTHNPDPSAINFSIEKLDHIDTSHYFFLGIHPWDIDQTQIDDQKDLLDHMVKKNHQHKNFLGLGEFGLDRNIKISMDRQQDLFNYHLELAKKFNIKLLVLHNVKTYSDSLELLIKSGYTGKIILHDYYKNLNIFKQYNSHFETFISLGERGLNSKYLNDYPLSSILLETDDSNKSINSIYELAQKRLQMDSQKLKELMHERLNGDFLS